MMHFGISIVPIAPTFVTNPNFPPALVQRGLKYPICSSHCNTRCVVTCEASLDVLSKDGEQTTLAFKIMFTGVFVRKMPLLSSK